jgi:4-hydroxybenzoate polyprenyltransferase
VREFASEPATIGTWLRALRVHQWLKNFLLFVPLLTAFSFDQLDKVLAASLAFLAFSLAASATYLLNDLWDLESDRAHPRKRYRPLASARIPVLTGVGVAACTLPVALLLAATVSPGFLAMLLLYVVLTSAYSWKLKRIVLVDVLMLSLLYTLRIIAGAVAIGVPTSSWLLAFSVFTFFSLALVKRCSELVSLAQEGKALARGRDYGVGDLAVLWPLGVGAAMCSVVVFGLFISAPETQARYATPELLWFIAVGLIYWMSRVWIKTSRGEMHDDPLVFAVRDRGSGVTMLGIVLTTLVAHYVKLNWI